MGISNFYEIEAATLQTIPRKYLKSKKKCRAFLRRLADQIEHSSGLKIILDPDEKALLTVYYQHKRGKL